MPGIDLCGCGKGISGKLSERTVTGQDLGELAYLPVDLERRKKWGHGTSNRATGSTSWQATPRRSTCKLSSAGNFCVGGKELIGRSAAVGSISVTLPGKAALPNDFPSLRQKKEEFDGTGQPRLIDQWE